MLNAQENIKKRSSCAVVLAKQKGCELIVGKVLTRMPGPDALRSTLPW